MECGLGHLSFPHTRQSPLPFSSHTLVPLCSSLRYDNRSPPLLSFVFSIQLGGGLLTLSGRELQSCKKYISFVFDSLDQRETHKSFPCCLSSNGSDLSVLHSIVPYEPRKRLRGHSD